jgi:hypothetical protein
MTDETKQIDVIMGPYRGNLLTVSAADADAAVNAHWARDPHSGEEYGTGHDPLSDEERAAALEAANVWAQAQWAAGTQAPPDPPPEGGETRNMEAGSGGRYRTRSQT